MNNEYYIRHCLNSLIVSICRENDPSKKPESAQMVKGFFDKVSEICDDACVYRDVCVP